MSSFIQGNLVQYNIAGGINSSKGIEETTFSQEFINGSTVDTGFITLFSIQIQPLTMISFEITFNAKGNNTNNGMYGKVQNGFYKNSVSPGVGVIRLGPIGGDGFVREDFVGVTPGIEFTNTGDVIFVRAVGTLGNNIDWFCEIKSFLNELS